MHVNQPIRLVNLGCGPNAQRTSWEDYDGSWNVLASRLPLGMGWALRKVIGQKNSGFPSHVRYLNVVRPLPFAAASINVVYLSHLLEHLYHDDGMRLIDEIYRVLMPGGIIRVIVPDTEHYIEEYLKRRANDPEACKRLNEEFMYRQQFAQKSLIKRLYTSATDFHSHKFMYDRSYLKLKLAAAGFSQVEEAVFGLSRVSAVSEIEHAGRLGGGAGFGFEAVKS